MDAQENLRDQLEGLLASNDLLRRAEVLQCVTDLFIHGSGKFSDDQLGFVRGGNFDRTAVALSIMCDLPIGLIERVLVQSEPEQLLVCAKAIDLSWETTKAVLNLQAARDGVAKERLNQYFASFSGFSRKPPGPRFSFIGCGSRRTATVAGRCETYFSSLLWICQNRTVRWAVSADNLP
jgi:hypothetical protein